MLDKIETPKLLAMMHVLTHYKSAYRSKESEYLGLGKVETSNPIIQTLIKNNFVSVRANGITPDRKGIREFCETIPRSMLGEYRDKLENVTLSFPLGD